MNINVRGCDKVIMYLLTGSVGICIIYIKYYRKAVLILEAKTYTCPNCGADLKFNADEQKFTCEFCQGSFTEEKVKELFRRMNEPPASVEDEEENDQHDESEREFCENTNLYQCPSCGAEIMADSNTAASFCYYCHNPVILKGRVDGKDKPSKVLPFSFGRDKAIEYFNQWVKDKKYVPNDLVSEKQIEKMTGLYVPFWVADATTNTRMTAMANNIRTWTSGGYVYTETSNFSVLRDVNIEYNGIPADGSKKIEDSVMEAIEPFDYTKLRDFDMSYLSGFFADRYDVNKEEMYPRIHQRMFENNTAVVESSCSYSNMYNKEFKNNVLKIRWNYMLLPVWFMTYKYKDRIWEYAINGQTGKVSGELPIDNKKLLRHQILTGLLIFLIIIVIGYFLGGLTI